MKVDFYDEVRRIMHEELNMDSESIKELIYKQIHQTVESVVNRAMQSVLKDTGKINLERLINSEISKCLATYSGRDVVEKAIKRVIPEVINIRVSIAEDKDGDNNAST